MSKAKGIAQAAREVGCSEWALRRLERRGVVAPTRDPWSRRLYSDADIAAAREHFSKRAASQGVAA
jgi:DNA-binding transcriptional MerR regulator